MKPSDFIVRIPEPCHEDWNAMQPDAKGKFCNSCQKSVFDFSNKTDREIRNILIEHKDQQVCGHFKKSQINRPLNITVNIHDLPRNMSITKMFGIALFLVFGSLLFSCTDEKGEKFDSVEIVSIPRIQDGVAGGVSLQSVVEQTVEPVYTVRGETYLEPEVYEIQNMVAGGITYEETPVVPPAPVVPVPVPETHYLGGLIAYNIATIDSVPPVLLDSTFSEHHQTITGEPQEILSKEFTVYPNPGNGEFTIKYDLLERSDVKITIFDMNGALVKSVASVAGQYEGRYRIPVNLSELPNGIYIVSFINGSKQSVERLVIAR